MKKFIVCAALTLAPIAFPTLANARQILPYLYAVKFCELAAAGVDLNDARRIAIQESVVSGDATMVDYHGKSVSSDTLRAAIAVSKLCPQYMK